MNAYPHPTGRPPARKRQGARVVVLKVLGLVAMFWMIYEVLGLGDVFGYAGLSNDDVDQELNRSVLGALFDPVALVVTTVILVGSIVIHLIARTTTTKVSMIISIVFYVLSFFRVSLVVSMMLSAAGAFGSSIQNMPDERVPTAEELVIEAPKLAVYRDSNGTRVTTALTNATEEHWESATVAVTVLSADGTVCRQYEAEEARLAPQERREFVGEFLDPAVMYSDSSCVPASATVTAVGVDVDSRSEIDPAEYPGAAVTPSYAALAPREEQGIVPGRIELSVAGALTPESMELLRSDSSLAAGFEVADAQGVRLAWCFRPLEVTADGSFVTRGFHSPVESGLYIRAIPVPGC